MANDSFSLDKEVIVATGSIRRRRTWLAAGGALMAASLCAATLPGLAPHDASASSHREGPYIAGLPQYDNTDVYAFVSPDKPDTVSLIANWVPFEDPAGGPNFYPFAQDAWYEIHVDNDGDARADVTFRYDFENTRTPGPADSFTGNGTFLYNNGPVESLKDDNLLFRQTYKLSRFDEKKNTWYTLLDKAPVAPSFVGNASMPNYAALRDAAVTTFGKKSALGNTTGFSGGKSFAGQAEDPFFLDLRVFNLLYGGDLSEVGNDTLAGYNVNSVALQIPTKDLVGDSGDPVVGVWSTTSRMNSSGKYVQLSRLGGPLVNEVVIPYHRKDRFNASLPRNDGQFANFVTNPELPKIVEALYDIPAPATPRQDLVAAFLTGVPGLNQPRGVKPAEMLRLNTKPFKGQKASRLGVVGGDKNGFPNGRRLTDDVLDIALQAAEGVLLPDHPDAVEKLGDGVNANDADFSDTFPYLGLPASGSTPRGANAPNSNADKDVTPLDGGAVPDEESGQESGQASGQQPGQGRGEETSQQQTRPAASVGSISMNLAPMVATGAGAFLLVGVVLLARQWWVRRRRATDPMRWIREG
jgi:Domain of unknown function (DUF4331)